jgi:hypothetical protein
MQTKETCVLLYLYRVYIYIIYNIYEIMQTTGRSNDKIQF